MTKRKILVTSALPYANGSIHLGHLVEYIQTDIWVRFQKMQGHEVHYVCADDTHGTPIMLRAELEGITPKQLIDRVWQEHKIDFDGFHVDFDSYYTTDSPENQEFCEDIYRQLEAKDLIAKRSVEQFYDPVKQMFLPDRYIKGECPKCHARDQYGDSCEACGATYSPTDLIDPYSAVSGAKPERRASKHHFFKLSDPRCKVFLKEWVFESLSSQSGVSLEMKPRLQPEAANKMNEWLSAGLTDWDISRDAPYFGFPIPGTARKKFFYVWLDAPVGYFGSFKHYFRQKNRSQAEIDEFLRPGGSTEMVHFIGKDILYFHALFWPAMLEFSGYRTPTQIYAHGFLTVNGQKMSKSRGTFITAESYLKQGLNPEWLRYYYAAKLNDSMEDIDLNFDDFTARVNSDLVGKYVNIASRCAGFIIKKFDGKLTHTISEANRKWFNQFLFCQLGEGDTFLGRHISIANFYERREFSKAIKEIMQAADVANQYVDRMKPWILAKNGQNDRELHEVCSVALNMFRILTVYLKPVLPELAGNAEQFLGLDTLTWKDANSQNRLLPDGHQINDYEHLMTRIDPLQIDMLVKANKESLQSAVSPSQAGPAVQAMEKSPVVAPSPGEEGGREKSVAGAMITIDDFTRIDLRVAKIVNAEHVEGADKLLKLTLDAGSDRRTVFAGIKSAYDPEQLKGRLTIMVANLAPRKMKFGISEGMVLAAGDGEGPYLLSPDEGAQPGMKVK
ncbi:methionine--tRNA ligase [Nitrosospira briensis]|uniref:Methionine--tRNA ligase n=1 Tax=Nitrosospira briensis TaxID=35799 RepID=A0A1I5D9N6_9PROT|nr:methionine--tRNA ligase [Nitrosospira briensis]SFN95922.1 methionyl-tRNA synthetase [Nitrosospira briensis]SFO19538.1 methionyl-tRNA synthetase [Nitrosospira briensis]